MHHGQVFHYPANVVYLAEADADLLETALKNLSNTAANQRVSWPAFGPRPQQTLLRAAEAFARLLNRCGVEHPSDPKCYDYHGDGRDRAAGPVPGFPRVFVHGREPRTQSHNWECAPNMVLQVSGVQRPRFQNVG